MSDQGKRPFAFMPGLPSREDAEVEALMGTVARLPRGSVEEIVRSLYRVALAQERTGSGEYARCLAEDALVTMRMRGDPDYGQALDEAASTPGDIDETVDVDEMLTRRGL